MSNHAGAAPVHGEASEIHDQRALGFWLYLMSDAVLFALLFMTYGIMVGSTDGGPTGKTLFSLSNAALDHRLDDGARIAFVWHRFCPHGRRYRVLLEPSS